LLLVFAHNLDFADHAGCRTVRSKKLEVRMMKALLVDDSKAARFAMRSLLEKQGLEVEIAESGEQALEKLAEFPVDIVFMDQSMPGMGGLEATRLISTDPATSTIPVVLCTGNEGDKLEHMAAEAGAVAVLTKPPQPERLHEILAGLQPPAAAEPEAEEAAEAATEAAFVELPAEAIVEEAGGFAPPMGGLSLEEVQALVQGTVPTMIDEALRPIQRMIDEAIQKTGDLENRVKGMGGTENQARALVEASSKEHMFQLESMRQQLEGSIDKLQERSMRDRDSVKREALHQAETLVSQRLVEIKDSIKLLSERESFDRKDFEQRLRDVQKGMLVKSIIIAVVAAGIAFAAAWLLG